MTRLRTNWLARPLHGRGLTTACATVFVVALAARLGLLLANSRLLAAGHFDEWVNFGASTLFANGEIPYRDFTFMHPPGIILAQLPNVLIGSLVSEPTGVVFGRITATILSSLCAVGLVWAARRFGAIAAVTAGLFYGLWGPIVRTDTEIQLEGYYNALILGAVLTLCACQPRGFGRTRSQKPPAFSWVRLVGCGSLLGLACSIKIVVGGAALVVVLYAAAVLGLRKALFVLAGVMGAFLAVVVPFAAQAPNAFLEQVLLAQAGRTVKDDALRFHLGPLSQLPLPMIMVLVVGGVVAAAIGLLRSAARNRPDLSPAVCLGVIGVVLAGELLVAPSYFPDYATVLGAPFALGIAAVVAWTVGVLPRRVNVSWATLAAAAAAFLTGPLQPGPITPLDFQQEVYQPQSPQTQEILSGASGCVYQSLPNFLIMGNRFSEMIANGCPYTLDPSGIGIVIHSGYQPAEYHRWNADGGQLNLIQTLASRSDFVLVDNNWRYKLPQWLKSQAAQKVAATGHLELWKRS